MTNIRSVNSAIRRSSNNSTTATPSKRYGNTYRLDPVEGRRFISDRAEVELRKAFITHLPSDGRYDAATCQKAALAISAQVRDALRQADLDRYKIICVCTVGERKQQDTCAAMRFLWDGDRDGFAKYYFETRYLFAIGLVFGVYHE